MPRDDPHRFLFYCPSLDPGSPLARLGGEEHHHASRVLRLREGGVVCVTNGRGLLAEGIVTSIGTDETVVETRDVVRQEEVPRPVTLALACLKKDAFAQAVKQCTEVGVTRFLPFAAFKSHLKTYSRSFAERLRRVALSSMKQSFRATLPVIEGAVPFTAVVEECGRHSASVVADAGSPLAANAPAGGSLLLVVGPEGGLTGDERERLAAAGARGVSLTRGRLRSETAAVTVAAWLLRAESR